jgi:hypothetical protein
VLIPLAAQLRVDQASSMQRELAERESDGIFISLRWDPGTGSLSVSVKDSRTGETFDLDANETNALDVFQHPYAYAARCDPRAIATGNPVSA